MNMENINKYHNEPLTATEIRRFPKELQDIIWEEQAAVALEIFNEHQELYDVPEIFDDIE
jgi:hypothetical protein